MKSIELTEEHKSKLLEMCKILFTEYNVRLLKPIFSCPDTFFIQMGLKSSNKYDLDIHWFEFCYGPLLSAIFNHKNYPRKVAWYDDTNGRVEFGNKFTWYNEEAGHPITFLYEEFKKLKL